MRRLLAVALSLFVMFGSVLGCARVGSHGAGGGLHPWTTAGTLRWADGEDLDNLNPLLSTQTLVADLSAFTMGYFFVFDDRNNAVPSLALEVPTRENGGISKDGARSRSTYGAVSFGTTARRSRRPTSRSPSRRSSIRRRTYSRDAAGKKSSASRRLTRTPSPSGCAAHTHRS